MTLQPSLEGLVHYRLSGRTPIVRALAKFRREWQLTANGESLVIVEPAVGLLLSYTVDQLRRPAQVRNVLLGDKLINEVDAFMEQRVIRKLPSYHLRAGLFPA